MASHSFTDNHPVKITPNHQVSSSAPSSLAPHSTSQNDMLQYQQATKPHPQSNYYSNQQHAHNQQQQPQQYHPNPYGMISSQQRIVALNPHQMSPTSSHTMSGSATSTPCDKECYVPKNHSIPHHHHQQHYQSQQSQMPTSNHYSNHYSMNNNQNLGTIIDFYITFSIDLLNLLF